jgi:CHAT domain-containing protein
LPRDAVLIDILEYSHTPERPQGSKARLVPESHLLAFVVRRDAEPRLVRLGRTAPVEDAVRSWRADLGAGVSAAAAGQRLRELVWAPLEKAFGTSKATQVLISSDGVLNQLPFGALPGRAPGTYLIEDRAIATVPAPQLLPGLLAPPTTTRLAGSLLALGAVNYDRATAAISAPGVPLPQAAARDVRLTFAALEGSRGEVARVEQIHRRVFGATGVVVLQGGGATEAAVRHDAPRHRYLHLATHGFFAPAPVTSALAHSIVPERPGQVLGGSQGVGAYHYGLLSGLALAGANAPLPDDDGVLTAEEVRTLNLSGVELAVLSACETGLGLTSRGEGLLGLQRAFHAAGARTVVASLWMVDDAATRALMERFYENLWTRKMGKLAALREAQLAMLRNTLTASRAGDGATRGLKGLDSPAGSTRRPPAFWAAFVLSGDWR